MEAAQLIAHEMGIHPDEVAERKAFLEFGESDTALLKEIHGRLAKARSGFTDAFYEYLRDFPKLRHLLPDRETVARLKRSHDRYFSQLTEGDYGWDYVTHRLNVGVGHSRIGLSRNGISAPTASTSPTCCGRCGSSPPETRKNSSRPLTPC